MNKLIDKDLVDRVLVEIDELEKEYQACQGLILTETDLQANLFSRLKRLFNDSYETINRGTFGSPLHTEVKFFDQIGKLTMVPDICIIAPEHLSIYHSVEFQLEFFSYRKYSSKRFEIGGDAIIIELKFCREQSGISEKHIASFQRDINKILKLQELVRTRSQGWDRLYGIFAVFNKTNSGKDNFDNFHKRNYKYHQIETVYKTGNADFSKPENQREQHGFILTSHTAC
ncbi:hypothetical protein LX99_04226 [Mucilaginibacter oryzae]|uniref:Uncharacterized protein n=1 Tax=Mucilaginibacter oryzae TaxID=468058 RepID=A0A316H1Y8_9SPHI|nr:hypothetical protein [Mucilaginibacter oryzae]PWK72896.1 hypothetical protein LX99_04226 [Mucilaginibacter oryzae]